VDIAKDRIRRCGKLLRANVDSLGDSQSSLYLGVPQSVDSGFRVLKIDTSNMREVYYTPDAVHQADLRGQIDNIRPDRAPEDLLFQVMVDWEWPHDTHRLRDLRRKDRLLRGRQCISCLL